MTTDLFGSVLDVVPEKVKKERKKQVKQGRPKATFSTLHENMQQALRDNGYTGSIYNNLTYDQKELARQGVPYDPLTGKPRNRNKDAQLGNKNAKGQDPDVMRELQKQGVKVRQLKSKIKKNQLWFENQRICLRALQSLDTETFTALGVSWGLLNVPYNMTADMKAHVIAFYVGAQDAIYDEPLKEIYNSLLPEDFKTSIIGLVEKGEMPSVTSSAGKMAWLAIYEAQDPSNPKRLQAQDWVANNAEGKLKDVTVTTNKQEEPEKDEFSSLMQQMRDKILSRQDVTPKPELLEEKQDD